MTELEIIEKLNSKRGELEEKRAANAGTDVISAIEKEIEELIINLQPVEKSRDRQSFLDECAG